MRNMCEILDKIENRGIEKGRAEGKAEGNTEGKSQMADLMKILLAENRIEDAKRAAEDPAYCDELMKQYGYSIVSYCLDERIGRSTHRRATLEFVLESIEDPEE